MSKKVRTPKKSGSFIRRLMLVSLLLVLSLGLANTIVTAVAAHLLLPVAAAGIQGAAAEIQVLAEFASASATATLDGLSHGESQQRFAILSELKEAVSSSNTPIADPQFTAWITPGLKHCQTDSDPTVVALADEILRMLEAGTEPVAK